MSNLTETEAAPEEAADIGTEAVLMFRDRVEPMLHALWMAAHDANPRHTERLAETGIYLVEQLRAQLSQELDALRQRRRRMGAEVHRQPQED